MIIRRRWREGSRSRVSGRRKERLGVVERGIGIVVWKCCKGVGGGVIENEWFAKLSVGF